MHEQKRITIFYSFLKANVDFMLLLQYILVTRHHVIQLAVGILGFCSTKIASVRQEDVFRITLPSGVPHLSIPL